MQSDPPATVCEVCGGAVEKLISRASFQFKGGGWYKDLYASSKPGDAKADGGGDAKTASDGAASSGAASDGGAASGGAASSGSSGSAAAPAAPASPTKGSS